MTPDRRLLLTLLDMLLSHLRQLPGETNPDRVLETLLESNTSLLMMFRDWPDLPAAYDDVPALITALCAELAELHEGWRAPVETEPPMPVARWHDPASDHWPNPLRDPLEDRIGPPRPAPPSAPAPPAASARPPRHDIWGGVTVRPSYGKRSGKPTEPPG